MSWKHLGETFDIHGGGIDLVFPHHENEIAQSRCAFHNQPFMANFWMHNGFLQVEGEKMSKSLGNFFTIRELLADWPGEVLRFNMLRTHYRQPLDWTVKGLEESQKILDDWHHILGDMETPTNVKLDEEVLSSLCDDLNTPNVLTRLHALASEIRGPASGPQAIEAKRTLKASGALLGLFGQTEADYLRSHPRRVVVNEERVKALIEARAKARAARNFAESDRIRDELADMGVELEDHKGQPTTWKLKRRAS
jgi:cysteinyl-tRNA synthetase